MRVPPPREGSRAIPRLLRFVRGAGAAGILVLASSLGAQRSTATGALPTDSASRQGSAPQGLTPAAPADSASIVVQNRVVFVLRAPLGSRSARERADDAARRIRALAEHREGDSIVARVIPQGMLIAVGDRGVFTITPADVDSAAGATLASASQQAVRALHVALVAEREQRSLTHLLTGIALSLVATILFFALLRLLRRGRFLALERLPTVARPRMPGVTIAGFTLLDGEQIVAFLRRIVDALAWGLGLFAAYLWLTYILTRFPYSAPWGEALGAYLVTTLRNLLLGALSSIPGLFTVVIIFFVTRFLTRLMATFFSAVEAGGVALPWVHADTAQPTRRLLSALLWLFALVVAYPYLPGSGSDVFKGVSVFVGIVLSLGSSGIVSQAMSGLVLMYARALKPGDYVRIGDTEGTVVELGMLSTKIRTNKDEEVTLPNGVVVGLTTKNYSRLASERGVVLYTSVTIRYDVPWRQVHAMLQSAANRTEGLRRDPPPFVLQTELSDWHVTYQLNVRLDQPHRRMRVLSELHANIQDVFYENGVDILSPHFEGNHEHPAIATIPAERWFAPVLRPAAKPADATTIVAGHLPPASPVREPGG